MAEQTAYFNLITRITTQTDPAAKTQLSAFETQFAKLTDASNMAGKAVATAAGFIVYQLVSTALMGIVNFVQGSVEAFVDFEYAMAGVARTVSDFAENDVALSDFARTMSMELGVSAIEVAEAMQYMGSVGMDSGEIMANFNDIAKMGVALQIDLQDAIQTSVRAQQIWNDAAYSSIEISDILNNMTNKTALNMEFLAQSLKMGGPAASATNTSLEQMVAILVPLAAAGFQGSMAGRSLNTIFIQIGLKAEELTDYLIDLKEQGFDVNMKAMEGFGEAVPTEKLTMLGEATENLTDSQKVQIAQMIGGTQFMKQMIVIMNDWENSEKNIKIAMDNANSTQEEFNVVMDTSQKRIDQLDQKMQESQRLMGETWIPIVLETKTAWAELALTIGNVINVTSEYRDQNKTWIEESKRLAEVQDMAKEALDKGIISQERYNEVWKITDQHLSDGIEEHKEFYALLNPLEVELTSYTDASTRNTEALLANISAVGTSTRANENLMVAQEEVKNATENLANAVAYATGEVSYMETATVSLESQIPPLQALYANLGSQLKLLQADLRDTEGRMDELKDSMYDNSLASAELRLDQMLLDRAFEEGEITEENYKKETEALNKELRDLRITGADLSIQNMKLTKTYEDQNEEAALVTDQMGELKDASDNMETALEAFAEATGNLNELLKQLVTLFGGVISEAGTFQSKIKALETQTGTSVTGMMSDWVQFGDAIKAAWTAQDWADYAQFLKDNDLTFGADPTSTPSPPPSGGTGGGGTLDAPLNYNSELGKWYTNAMITNKTFDTKALLQAFLTSKGYAQGFEGWVNQPTMMMVGEKGAEYVSVKNQNQSPGQGGGMGGGNVTINLPNVTSVEDPAQVRRIFRRIMLELGGER